MAILTESRLRYFIARQKRDETDNDNDMNPRASSDVLRGLHNPNPEAKVQCEYDSDLLLGNTAIAAVVASPPLLDSEPVDGRHGRGAWPGDDQHAVLQQE